MVTKDEFRKCMAEFATGVTVVTTFDEHGQVHGMSANSFTSVCLEPPLVLVCVGHNTHTFKYVEERRCFGVNVLSANQEDIGRYFARPPEKRESDVAYDYSISEECGVPALLGVLAFFGCQVESSHVHGDHTVYVASVQEMYSGDADAPLLFFQSKWYANLEVSS